MRIQLGDRDLDASHRAVVVGLVAADTERSDLVGADAVVAEASSRSDEVWDGVGVPVGVVVSPGQVAFPPDGPIRCVGPFDADAPTRIAQLFAAVVGGERVVLSTTVSSDRRVVEVMDRILSARERP